MAWAVHLAWPPGATQPWLEALRWALLLLVLPAFVMIWRGATSAPGRLGLAAVALARQSSELIYEVLRWRAGTFRFIAGAELPPHVVHAQLQLDVEAVLMEGYRRVDEWHLIERAIG